MLMMNMSLKWQVANKILNGKHYKTLRKATNYVHIQILLGLMFFGDMLLV